MTYFRGKRVYLAAAAVVFGAMLLTSVHRVKAQGPKKPNILFIMGDDIGWYNPSIYNRGDMGYQTPNIDRIGKEGAMFTSWYGQQSCTAGARLSSRASRRSGRD